MAIDIIRTKLHRPPVTKDLVPRAQLLKRLEYRRQRPLTLISAPAGYGKSTLASHWVDVSACPGAWVSLDVDDSDLRRFLTYVVAAIQTLFPTIGHQTLALLNAAELPPGTILAHTLLNELARLRSRSSMLTEAVNTSSAFNSINFGFSTFALALTYQAREQPEDAWEAADKIVALAIEMGNSMMLGFAQAFQAELDLRQGRLANASAWAQRYDPSPLLPMTRAYLPQLTYVKVLLVQATPDSRQRADGLLEHLHDYYEGVHNRRFVIEILALQALLADAMGDQPAALSSLERAITLAEPGGYIRLFVDLGPRMASLLKRLMSQNMAIYYIRQLLAAFSPQELSPGDHAFHQPIVPSNSQLIDDNYSWRVTTIKIEV